MADRMSREQRAGIDVAVFARVKAGEPYRAVPGEPASVTEALTMRVVDASLQRQRRSGALAYDHNARKWGVSKPVAEKPARGPGRAAKSIAKPKARTRLRKVQAGTSPGAKARRAKEAKANG